MAQKTAARAGSMDQKLAGEPMALRHGVPLHRMLAVIDEMEIEPGNTAFM